jgi:hypothetical protein
VGRFLKGLFAFAGESKNSITFVLERYTKAEPDLSEKPTLKVPSSDSATGRSGVPEDRRADTVAVRNSLASDHQGTEIGQSVGVTLSSGKRIPVNRFGGIAVDSGEVGT